MPLEEGQKQLPGLLETHAVVCKQVDTHYPQRVLSDMVAEIKKRCIISATISESLNTKVNTELRAKPKVFKSSMGQWMETL